MALGIVCVIIASVSFGIGSVFAKELLTLGLNTFDIMFYQKIITLSVIGIIFAVRRISVRVTKKQLWQLFLYCGLCNGLTGLLLVSSYNYLPIGIATMLHFIYPVVVTVFMVAFFKEKASAIKLICIAVAIFGLYLILDISGSISFIGITLALGSGFAYAIYVIANKKSKYKDLPALVVVFYSDLIGFIILIPIQLARGQLKFALTGLELLFISASALISCLLSFFTLIIAIRRIGASNAAIANMLEPITALVAGAIIFGDRIEFKALCGCILVLMAITLVAINGKRASDANESNH